MSEDTLAVSLAELFAEEAKRDELSTIRLDPSSTASPRLYAGDVTRLKRHARGGYSSAVPGKGGKTAIPAPIARSLLRLIGRGYLEGMTCVP